MQITLGKKLFLYTSGILIVVLLVTFLFLERIQSRQWDEHLLLRSISFARLATPELLKTFRGEFPPQQDDQLREVYDFLGFNRDLIQFSLLSPGGRVLFESSAFSGYRELKLPTAEDAEVRERMKIPRTTVRTLDLAGGGRVLELITPAFGPTGEQVLAARYLVSYDSVDARLAEVRLQFLRIAGISLLSSLLLAALVSRRVTRPIKELTAGAKAVARDELETRIEVGARDEIGTLARTFNEMAASLLRNRRELTDKNTALAEANRELQQMQENLVRTERLAAIGQLAAGISHEIDNPVGITLGYAELLYDELDPEDPRREDVRAIIEECRRCKRITGGLLGFVRAAPEQRMGVDLKALAEEVMASLRPQKLFKGVAMRLEAEPQLQPVRGDPDRLRQVLVNLLLNAGQAMAGEGEVRVRLSAAGDANEIRIVDTGPGLPEEGREKIFEPFFSTKERGEGTGLGLAVCRKLVEDHGGRLVAEEVAGGACFRVTLPVETAEKNFDKDYGDSLG